MSTSQKPRNVVTESQKHRDFVAEPMGNKPVTDLPGIGHAYGDKLKAEGFDRVSEFKSLLSGIGNPTKEWPALVTCSCTVHSKWLSDEKWATTSVEQIPDESSPSPL